MRCGFARSTVARAVAVLAVAACASAPAPDLDALIAQLEDPRRAEAAVAALRVIEDDAVDRRLIARLEQSWSPADGLFAALGARRSRMAVESLLGFAEGGAPARAARHALAQIGDTRAEAVLRAALEDQLPGAAEDWAVFRTRRINP